MAGSYQCVAKKNPNHFDFSGTDHSPGETDWNGSVLLKKKKKKKKKNKNNIFLRRENWRAQLSIATLASWQLTVFPAANTGRLAEALESEDSGISKPKLAMGHGQDMEPPGPRFLYNVGIKSTYSMGLS